jgi:hypothetical protein
MERKIHHSRIILMLIYSAITPYQWYVDVGLLIWAGVVATLVGKLLGAYNND